jgi:hypothetical protein
MSREIRQEKLELILSIQIKQVLPKCPYTDLDIFMSIKLSYFKI